MTYERIFELATAVVAPSVHSQLAVEWIVRDRLAIGRDSANRHVLLLAGAELHAASSAVEQVLSYGRWMPESGIEIEGTVIRLHDGEPFQVAATTIATELLRRGIETRPVIDVFRQVESFIELVIRSILLPPNSLLGLVGELILLEHVVESLQLLPPEGRPSPVSIWRGFTSQSRDFSFNRLSIEVKTTSGHSSRHQVGSLDQVEPRSRDGGHCEVLFLASFGLAEDVGGTGRFSVAQLAERIFNRLTGPDRLTFLDQLRQYGPDDCVGYDHDSMSTWEPYARRFRLLFEPRLYDMSDPNVKVLRRQDLQELFVLSEGISYVVDLPADIPGSFGANPRTDMSAEVLRLFSLHS